MTMCYVDATHCHNVLSLSLPGMGCPPVMTLDSIYL